MLLNASAASRVGDQSVLFRSNLYAHAHGGGYDFTADDGLRKLYAKRYVLDFVPRASREFENVVPELPGEDGINSAGTRREQQPLNRDQMNLRRCWNDVESGDPLLMLNLPSPKKVCRVALRIFVHSVRVRMAEPNTVGGRYPLFWRLACVVARSAWRCGTDMGRHAG